MKTTRYLLIEEVAQIARTSPGTVRWWIRLGYLGSSRPGRRRLIREDELAQFLEQTGRIEAKGARRNKKKPAKRQKSQRKTNTPRSKKKLTKKSAKRKPQRRRR